MKLWKVALISTPIAIAIIGLISLIGVGLGKKDKKTTTKPTDTTVTPTPVVEKYSVNVVNEISGITISGTGDYEENETVTLTASGIKPGDFFTWSINGSVVEVGNTLILTVEKSNINITIDLTRYDYLYYKTESNIYFGSYPQTLIKNEDIIKELNEKSGGFDENTWTDYEYYVEGEKESFMFYKDIDLNNDGFNDYRGIYFKQYRPDSTMVGSTASFQDNWGYNTNTIYWFSFDPIKWNIVTVEDNKALLWASLNLDSQDFYNFKTTDEIEHNGGTGYANNYELSDIRIWLNDNFYNSAFNDLQKTLIINTLVKNDIEQVYLGSNDIEAYRAKHEKFQNYDDIDKFASNDTQDNVFIFSLRELYDYFDTDNDANIAGSVLRANPTDYAKSQGALKDSSSRTVSLLRSFGNSADCANYIAEGGGLISGNNTPYRRSVAHTQTCIRPALWIDLSGTDYKKVTVTSSNDEAGFISANGEFGVLNNYAMTLKAIPNDGYTFVGWFVGDEAVSTDSIYTFDVNADIEIEAKWIVNQYMINVVNKSSYDFDYTHGGQYDYKSSVTLEFNQPEGYSAKLYNEKEELLTLDDNTYTLTMPYYDIEYSVYYELITYKIIYDVPYGTVNTNPTTHTVEDGEFTLVNPIAPAEFTFNGWYIDDELTTKIPGHVTKNIYVYGDFTSEKHRVNIINNTAGLTITGEGEYYHNDLVRVAIENNAGFKKAMAIELKTLDKDNKEVIRIFNREEYEFYMPNHNVTLTIMDIDNSNYYNGESPEENRNFAGDEILYFGTYPQALVKDRDINARLVELAGKNPTETGATGWIDYGFYEQDTVKSYMWYKDITLNNDKYRAVYFTEYRPGHIDWDFSSSEPDPDRPFNKDEIHFFKFEPIAWKKSVKNDGNNLYAALLCLDAQSFVTNTNPSSTSYDGSYLRSFLLNTFCDTAFNSTEKSLLENSYSGDKVSIFKYENGILGDYENVSDHLGGTKYLKSDVTDYALCLRPKSKDKSYIEEGRGTYYLSRESSSSNRVRIIHDNTTNTFVGDLPKKTVLCIRPIIRLDVTKLYSVFMYVNDSEGGTASGGGTYINGSHVTLTATPKEGYAFIGWTDNRTGETFTTDATYEFNIDKNYSLTAVFLKKYYIKYEGIEDADNKGNPEYYTTEYSAVSLFQPTKEGYKFDKWTRNGEYFNFQFETSLEEDITIKANWIALEYDINYSYVDLDGNDISNVSNQNNLKYTYDSGNINLQVATHENYELVEWRNEKDEVVTFINNDSIDKTTGKITLVAIFKPNKYEVIVHNFTDGLEISNGGLFDYNSDVTISLLTDTDTFELFIEANFSDGVVKAVTKDYTFKMPGYTLDIYASKIEVSNYVDDGKDVYYGSYPQTLVTDETTNAELLILAGTAPTVENFNDWTDYGFYENGEQKSFAWYKDVVYNNEKYRGVYFTNYRPSAVNNTFSDMISDYDTNKIYFFKFEAIRWMCYGTTTTEDGKSYNMYTTYFVLDEYHRYATEKQYPYYQGGSALREFITGSFYDLLFSDSRTDILGDIYVNDNNKYDKVSIFSEKADVQSYLGNTAYMKVPQSDYAACLRPINQVSDLKNGAGGAYHLRTINVSWGYGNIIRDAASSTLEHSIDERIICGIRPIIYLSSDVYKVNPSINVSSAGTVSGRMAYFANTNATVKVEVTPNSGYKFIGWKVNDAIVSNLETYTFAITEDVDIEAVFAKIYDIAYHNIQEGITNPNRLTYTEYDEFNLENIGALNGYEFKGFYTDSEFSSESKITKVELGTTGNLDIYAKYELITYTINYNLKDGEINDTRNVESFNILSEDINLYDASKEYYDFNGWYTDKSFSETSKIEVIESGTYSNIVLYPKFTPTNYTITYHLESDETNGDNPASFNVLDCEIRLKDPSKGEYYDFIGWYTNSSFDEDTKIKVINTSTPINYDLYPKFNKTNFEVRIVNNTGLDITINGYGEHAWDSTVTLEAIIGTGVETFNMIVKYVLDFDSDNPLYGLTATFTMPKDIVVVTVSYEQICEINNQNGYVIMGTYPKTLVVDTTLVGNLNANYNFNEDTWIKYDYEAGTMYYLDVDFGGNKYRGVYIINNRNQAQVDNGYPISDGIYHGMYWFKYEPIRWRILSNDTETEYYLISEDILDCNAYNSVTTGIKADYDTSTIKDFLLNTFASMVFNGAEETIIEHDVSLFAQGSEDNPELDVFFNSTEDRIASPSDYAKCQGLTVNGDGNSAWWLATPDYSENDLAYQVNAYGGDYSVNVTSLLGVRPVIWIKLQ